MALARRAPYEEMTARMKAELPTARAKLDRRV